MIEFMIAMTLIFAFVYLLAFEIVDQIFSEGDDDGSD
jgi:hypothetical protein